MSALITRGLGVSIGLIITSGLGADSAVTTTPGAPIITNVSVSYGTTVGGDTITITGTDLAGTSAVTFGGTSAVISANDSTSATVTSPAHSAGFVSVAATTFYGTSTASNAFLFIHPSSTPLTAIYSGQTASGTHQLFLGLTTIPLVQGSHYLDAGTAFPATVVTNLFDLVPLGNPSQYGVVDHIEVETNGAAAPILGYLTDEDPAGAGFQTAFTAIDPPNRAQGSNLVETWYPVLSYAANPAARRVSVGIQWNSVSTNFKLYGVAIAYEEKG